MKEAPSPTRPIDEAELRNKRRLRRIGIAAGSCVSLVIILIQSADRNFLYGIAPWEWLGVLVGSIYAALISHETGHLIAGWLAGLELNAFHISPITLQRKSGGWKLEFNKQAPMGYVSMLPRSYERIHQRLQGFMAGGPLANIALSASCGIFLSLPLGPVWQRFLITTATFSLLLGLINLIPFEEKNLQSDGARLRMIRRQPKQAERWIATIALSSALVRGVRPGDLSADVVERAIGCPDRSQDHIAAVLMAVFWAEAREDYDQAQAYLDPLLADHSYASPQSQASILIQGALFYSYHRRNPVLARRYWDQVKPLAQHIPHQTLLYVRITLLVTEGRLDEARARLKEYMQARKDSPYAWIGEAEEKWLAAMRSTIGESGAVQTD